MKVNPKYSYEFNCILNENFKETEQIKNFASLISDKDRFLSMLPFIEKNSKLIEEKSGFKLPKEIDFYIVRAEKFKSFSEPITIEYSLLPEEMIAFLLKEIVKTYSTTRFTDEITREKYINSFIDYIIINGDFGNLNLIKFGKNLHEESKSKYENYEYLKLDFDKKTLKRQIEELYE